MLSTGVAIQSLLAIVQFFAQRVEAFKWLGIAAHTPFFLGDSVVWVEQGRVLRAYGGLPHPNILGGWLVVGSLLSIAAIVKAKSKKIRFSLLVMYVFILIGLFFTFSKSAWIAFIVALTLLGAWVYAFHGNLLEQKARTIFTQIFAVTAVFFVLFPFLYRDMIVSRVSPFQLQQNHLEQRSYLERYASMKEAFSLLKQHLFLGVGPGAYTHALRYYFEPKALYELQPVHNVALLQTVELGVVGFFVWVFFVFFIVQKIVKEGSIYSIILLSPILPLSLFDHYLWSMYPGLILLAIMFASSIGFSRKKISSYGG